MKYEYGDEKLLGREVKIKGLDLYTTPSLPPHDAFMPFSLIGYLGEGRVKLALVDSLYTYSVLFSKLGFEDKNEIKLAKIIDNLIPKSKQK